MDGLKDVLGFLTAVLGLVSALIPIIGYIADKRRRASALVDPRISAPRGAPEYHPEPAPGAVRSTELPEPKLAAVRMAIPDSAAFAKAEQLVRNPAIFMIVVGGLSLTTNLLAAGIASVDQFVTPLGINQPRGPAMQPAPAGPFGDGPIDQNLPDSDRNTTTLGIIGMFFFSLASAVAIWSGYNMLKLRNYWLALAGSIALVPGSCMCCFLGIPSGIWSFVVLINPEVSAAFRYHG
jgi:hypothetical protein